VVIVLLLLLPLPVVVISVVPLPVASLVATLVVARMMTLESTIAALALVASMRITMTRYYHR